MPLIKSVAATPRYGTNGPFISRDPLTAVIDEPLHQYRRLLESLTGYAIFTLSIEGVIESWNSGARQTFGYAESEALGKHYSLLFTAEDVALGKPETELIISLNNGKSTINGWLTRKGGSWFACTSTVQPLRDEDNELIGFTKLVQDSTESLQHGERFRESEERLRLLTESATDYAIFSIGLDGSILIWNSGAERIFGYRGDEVLGRHFSLIYTPEAVSRGAHVAEMKISTESGHAPGDGWYARKDGEPFYATGKMTRLKAHVDGEPRGFVKIIHDLTQEIEAEATFKQLAMHDPLTNLVNRSAFNERVRESITLAKDASGTPFAVVFLDLDRFKNINDSLGHVIADKLLIYIARTLEKCVRPGDIVARLGGDEFTVLLAGGADTDDVTAVATSVADRIQAALQKPVDLDGFEVFTTASMGIAIGSGDYDKPEHILRDADTAMYEAKARGRSQHILFDPHMHAKAVDLLKLQMGLRRAVARGEFGIVYQPIVNLDDSRLIGFEALVRWNHPERGILSPVEFIHEAENIGLIIQIDHWVLHEACRQIRAWQIQYKDPALIVSVNLSSRQFGHPNLLWEIREALKRNALPPQSLKLEITETVLMENFEQTAAVVGHVDEMGVELYIDDFGTGYSSLSYLTRLPLRLLKVDQSFVSEFSANPRSAEIAHTIVSLAHNLGLTALAEGIETEEQLTKLRDLGCELGQGYWFSRPLPADEAAQAIGCCLPHPNP